MIIREKLKFSIVISLITVMFFISMSVIKINDISNAYHQRLIARQIRQELFELNVLTNEYLKHHEVRPEIQWKIKNQSLNNLLGSITGYNDIDRELIVKMKKSKESIEKNFFNLKAIVERSDASSDDGMISDATEQILINSQRLASHSYQLLSNIDRQSMGIVGSVRGFVFIFTACLLVVIVFLIRQLYKNIITPISKLYTAAQQLAEGKKIMPIQFEYKNEFIDLYQYFFQLTSQMEKREQELIIKNRDLASIQKELEDREVAMLNMLEDIEHEREKNEILATDLKKFKLAAENTSDQVIITDSDGIIIYANPAATTISGFTTDEIIHQKAWTIKLGGGNMPHEFYENMWQTIKEQKAPFAATILNHRKSGEEYYLSTTISPILDQKNNIVFFISIGRDTTKEENIDKAKSEFVSLASHQLRTPLSVIKWYTEMLLSGDATKIQKKEYAEQIYQSTKNAVDIVDTLLDVSRLELGTYMVEPEQIRIAAVVKGVIDEMKIATKEKKLSLKISIGKDIPATYQDPRLLRIIFQNLLSNAIKYTSAKGKITASLAVQDNKYILFTVSDTGCGIPKGEQDRMFTKFFRASNVLKQSEGTGLGLYIVKSVVHRLRGTLWFESKENKGTTFFVRIPLVYSD